MNERTSKLVSRKVEWLDGLLASRTCSVLSPCRARIDEIENYPSYEEWYEEYYRECERLNDRFSTYWESSPYQASRLNAGWVETIEGRKQTVEEQSWFVVSPMVMPYGEYDGGLLAETLNLSEYYNQAAFIFSYPVEEGRFLARFHENVGDTGDFRPSEEFVFTSWKQLESLVGEDYWSAFYDRPEGDPEGFQFTAVSRAGVRHAWPTGWWNVAHDTNKEIRTGRPWHDYWKARGSGHR